MKFQIPSRKGNHMKLHIFCIIFFCFFSTIQAKTLLLVTLESPPAEYMENQQAKGFNVDIAKEALSRMGYKADIKLLPWKRALYMVENGLADGVIDAAYNKTRAQYMYYPDEEINTENWYAFKVKDSNITLDKDFKNAKNIELGISRNFVYGGEIQKAIDNNMFKYLDEVYNNELNIKKVVAGRFDMFLGVKSTIFSIAKRIGYYDKIEITKMTETNEDYLLNSEKTYLGFSKKTIKKEFVTQFSNILTQMKKDGTTEKIRKKYY